MKFILLLILLQGDFIDCSKINPQEKKEKGIGKGKGKGKGMVRDRRYIIYSVTTTFLF